jgi:hypothetical protein
VKRPGEKTTGVSRKKVENVAESLMLTGMIVSDSFLRQIEPIYKEELVETTYVRKVAGWCMDYWRRYGSAPGEKVETLFKSHRRKNMEEDEATLIRAFLSNLSEQYEETDQFNVDYALDLAVEHFRAVNLQIMAEDVLADLSQNRTKEAEGRLVQFQSVQRPLITAINPYTDKEAVYEAFEEGAQPLFTLPGAAGQMMNEHLVREGFVAYMGREKIGKTWVLGEMEFRAHLARQNTVFFGVGDMSRKQMIRRRHNRLAGKSWLHKYCSPYLCPVLDCAGNQKNLCTNPERPCGVGLKIDTMPPEDPEEREGWKKPKPEEIAAAAPAGYAPCSYCQGRRGGKFRGAVFYEMKPAAKPLEWREGLRLGRAFAKSRLRGRNAFLECYPTDSMSVSDLNAQLDIWETFEGWIADVVIIDYADILAAEPGTEHLSTRDQENAKWKALRRMSMDRHCLVVTATQADAKGLEAHSLRLRNFSEDKRKYSHVTAIASLQRTEDEEWRSLARWGLLLIREGQLEPGKQATVLYDLRGGNPLVASFW